MPIDFKLVLERLLSGFQEKNIRIADIEMLASLHNRELDWELLKRYFTIFQMDDLFRNIKEAAEE